MKTAEIRQKLHEYIDTVEDKKINAIYVMLEESINNVSLLSEEQKHELDRRIEDYKKNGNTYSWEETVSRARQAAKERLKK